MYRHLGKYIVLGAAAFMTLCGPVSSAATPTVLKTQILVGNYGPKWSFDIGAVDSTKGLYMLADRNSAALDVFDIATSKMAFQVPGFTGFKGAPKLSGPQGIATIPGTSIVYVGDVNSVKVVDLDQKKIVKSIATTNTGFRTDEGCYDPDDKVMMFASPNDPTPNSVFISTTKQAVLGKITFPGADGLEACSYDSTTKSFYQSVPATKANPGGEIAVVSGADAASGSPKLAKVYPLTGCNPTGNVFGPTLAGKPQLLITCDTSEGEKGAPISALIMNVIDGSTITIPQIGNADQVDYNSKTNKYYLAARAYYASGKSGVGPKTPVIGVVDAGTATTPPAFIENIPTCTPSGDDGCNSVAHSVATDASSGRTFVPVGSSTASVINVYGQADMP